VSDPASQGSLNPTPRSMGDLLTGKSSERLDAPSIGFKEGHAIAATEKMRAPDQCRFGVKPPRKILDDQGGHSLTIHSESSIIPPPPEDTLRLPLFPLDAGTDKRMRVAWEQARAIPFTYANMARPEEAMVGSRISAGDQAEHVETSRGESNGVNGHAGIPGVWSGGIVGAASAFPEGSTDTARIELLGSSSGTCSRRRCSQGTPADAP
jgi:hypothetical protein